MDLAESQGAVHHHQPRSDAVHTAQLDQANGAGFATDIGSKTSHTAIMARSLRIPAVVGLKDASNQLETGQYALLDGYQRRASSSIRPTRRFSNTGRSSASRSRCRKSCGISRPSRRSRWTGIACILSANIEQATDAEEVRANGAEGVGLFRTEYLFINREASPTEEEQYQAYRQVASALKPSRWSSARWTWAAINFCRICTCRRR